MQSQWVPQRSYKDMVQNKEYNIYRLRKIFNISGSTTTQRQETERLREVFTGACRGLASWLGLQGGSAPLPKKILYFAS